MKIKNFIKKKLGINNKAPILAAWSFTPGKYVYIDSIGRITEAKLKGQDFSISGQYENKSFEDWKHTFSWVVKAVRNREHKLQLKEPPKYVEKKMFYNDKKYIESFLQTIDGTNQESWLELPIKFVNSLDNKIVFYKRKYLFFKNPIAQIALVD